MYTSIGFELEVLQLLATYVCTHGADIKAIANNGAMYTGPDPMPNN